MRINDFISLLLNEEICEFCIYADDEELVFEGCGGDIPSELQNAEIDSTTSERKLLQ